MKKEIYLFIIAIAFLLTNCRAATESAPTITATVNPTNTLTVTPTIIPSATVTLTPTPTIVPSSTVTLSPTPGVGTTQKRESDGMTMMYVPAGEFTMGFDLQENILFVTKHIGAVTNDQLRGYQDEEPVHTVYLDSFWIDQTEVTNGMYALCVEAGDCSPPITASSQTREEYFNNPEFADYPVVNVSRNDGEAYCEWAGARLPSEAEWEKAARGEEGGIFPWGNEIVSCELANVWMSYPDKPKEFCVGDTVQVGSYPAGASPYGVLDMAGNVSEWVADWYDPGYYAESPAENPAGPDTGSFYTMVGGEWVWEYGSFSIARGGDWYSLQHQIRTFSRYGWNPEWGVYNVQGFRCAQSAP